MNTFFIYTFLYILFMLRRLLFQMNFKIRFQSFDEDNLLSYQLHFLLSFFEFAQISFETVH